MSWWTRTTAGAQAPADPGATQVVAGVPTRERRTGGFLSLGTVLTVVAALSATLLGGGLASKHSDILDGNTWIISASRDGVERLLRVNPGSGEVDLDTPSPLPPGRTGTVQQSNVTTAVVDATSGDTFAWDPVDGQWQKSTTKVSGDTALHLTTTSAFSVDRAKGMVRQLDPTTLSAPVGPAISLGGPVSESVVDGSGELWLAMPAAKRVVAVDGSDLGPAIGRRFDLPTSGSALSLTALHSGVMAGDAGGHTTYRLVPENDAAERISGVPPTPAAVSAASSDDDTGAVLDPDAGKLTRVTATGDDRAQSIQLTAALTGHRFGRPVVFADRVYLPDYSAGRVLRSTANGRLEVFPPRAISGGGSDFDLFVDDGRLWVNSRTAARAFSVDQAGNWTPIAKATRKRIQPPKLEPSSPPKTKTPTIDRDEPTARPTGRPRNRATPRPTVTTRPTRTPTPTPPRTTTPVPTTAPPTTTPPTTTPAVAPGAPANLAAAAGDTTLTVTWDPPTEGADDVTSYLVEWTGPDGTPQSQTRGANARTVVITGLTNGSAYDVSVTAISSRLRSDPTRISATPVTKPAVALSDAQADGIGRVTVSFTVDQKGSGAVTCRILFNGGEQFKGNCAGGAQSRTIDGLATGTNYTVAVEAGNNQGEVLSDERSVTTWAEPTVSIEKSGESAVGDGNPKCTDPSCEYIRVTIKNFTPGQSYTMTAEDNHAPGGYPSKTLVPGADGSKTVEGNNAYFFGFKGFTITVTVGGYKSNSLRW